MIPRLAGYHHLTSHFYGVLLQSSDAAQLATSFITVIPVILVCAAAGLVTLGFFEQSIGRTGWQRI
jgi:hypothetical protein